VLCNKGQAKTHARTKRKNNALPFPAELDRRDEDTLIECAAVSATTDFELAGNSQLSAGADMLRLRRPFDVLVS
jgi:hypothetical protein